MVQTFSPFSNNTRDVEDFADYDNYEIKMTLRRKRCRLILQKKSFSISRANESFEFTDLNKRHRLGLGNMYMPGFKKKGLTKIVYKITL